MDAYVEVTDSSGTTERYPIEGTQITLGKSGTADISLPTSQDLELEHLLIAPRGKEGCWISTSQGAFTPTTYRGKPFDNGIVKWGSELVIGRVRVKVTNRKPKVQGEGPSKVVVIGGVAAVGILAFTFLRGQDVDVPTGEGIEPPPLFAALPTTCEGEGTTAERAQTAEYRGHVKGDRYYYAAESGVEAIFHYATAVACLRADGEGEAADEVDAFREELQSTIEADYAGLRLHLRHAIRTEDWKAASRDVDRLVGMTQHLSEGGEDNPYVAWLRQTQRIVRARALQQRDEEENSSRRR